MSRQHARQEIQVTCPSAASLHRLASRQTGNFSSWSMQRKKAREGPRKRRSPPNKILANFPRQLLGRFSRQKVACQAAHLQRAGRAAIGEVRSAARSAAPEESCNFAHQPRRVLEHLQLFYRVIQRSSHAGQCTRLGEAPPWHQCQCRPPRDLTRVGFTADQSFRILPNPLPQCPHPDPHQDPPHACLSVKTWCRRRSLKMTVYCLHFQSPLVKKSPWHTLS